MALKSFSDLSANDTLKPTSEQLRILTIERNRKLFEGNFVDLSTSLSTRNAVKTNWFRRIATFYPEFMLSDRPTITIQGNDRLTQLLADREMNIFQQLHKANVDLLAYGEGIISVHPLNPLEFVAFDPDKHYEVVDPNGTIVGDICIRVRGELTNDAELDIFYLPIVGESRWVVFNYVGGAIGAQKRNVPIPPRAGRQVARLRGSGTSIFDDIKTNVGEMSLALTSLSKSIERNARPHLYGPDGIVRYDERGAAEIDVDGMYFPLQENDSPPGYLQWDSKEEAVRYSVDQQLRTIFSMSSLSQVLFNPDVQVGQATGTALRRLMLPFVAKLEYLSRLNEETIERMIAILNINGAANGQELFVYRPSDIDVQWKYLNVFVDDDTVEETSEEREEEDENPNRDN